MAYQIKYGISINKIRVLNLQSFTLTSRNRNYEVHFWAFLPLAKTEWTTEHWYSEVLGVLMYCNEFLSFRHSTVALVASATLFTISS